MKAKLVYDGGNAPPMIPEEMGTPKGDQFQGTPREQTAELAGRVCYDSLGQGRSSQEYHKHIHEVGHFSVYEHTPITVAIPVRDDSSLMYFAIALANRPGVWWIRPGSVPEIGGHMLRVTANFRAIVEWHKRMNPMPSGYGHDIQVQLGNTLARHVKQVAPQIMPIVQEPFLTGTQIVDPHFLQEKWITLYMKGSRGFCYDEKTEVLTDEGWKPWVDVRGDENFATLNMDSDELEYQQATDVIRERYSGRMYRLKSKMVDLLVTPNHRMVVKKHDTRAARRGEEPWGIATAEDSFGKRMHYRRWAKWVGESPKTFTIPSSSTEYVGANQSSSFGAIKTYTGTTVAAVTFAEFLGYWLAEGHLAHTPGSSYRVVITQNPNSPAYKDMLHALEAFGKVQVPKPSPGGCVQPYVCSKPLYDYLKPYSGAANKAVPTEIKGWGPSYQRTLIDAYLAGDGSSPRRGTGEGHTVSRRLADDLQESALKAGMSATIREVDRRDEDTPIKHRRVIYVVSFCGKRNEPLVNHNGKSHDSWEDYDGMIYCVTVPNGTLYVRRNGRPVWSGNSHEQVRHGDWTAISQRSTRYVDESGSPWVRHPLLAKYIDTLDEQTEQDFVQVLDDTIEHCGKTYDEIVARLQPWCLENIEGITKLGARKQGRGAARGFLGNALTTEMIFSASAAQWAWMIGQRASRFADAEIREIYSREKESVIEALWASRYGEAFANFEIKPSPDGIGTVVELVKSSRSEA